jgi:hypothetical protein
MSTPTLHDHTDPIKMSAPTTVAQSTMSDKEAQQSPKSSQIDPNGLPGNSPGASHEDAHVHPLAALGDARKNFLLLIFAVATFVDVCNVSGVAGESSGFERAESVADAQWPSRRLASTFSWEYRNWSG